MKNFLKILDRYIIGKYLKTFFFTAFLFSMIIIVIDTSEKLLKFLTENVSIKEIILNYYAGAIPTFNWLLWPLFCLISVIFFTSRMASDNEVISILNAGVNYRRFLQPFIIAALFIFGIHIIGNHFFLPKLNQNRIIFEAKYIKKNENKDLSSNIHFTIDRQTNVFFKYYSRSDSSAKNIRIETYKDGALVNIYEARTAKYNLKLKKWVASDILHHSFDGIHEKLEKYPSKIDTIDLKTDPSDFYTLRNFQETLTSPNLWKVIQKERLKGTGGEKQYLIELHRRTADSFTILILTFMGVCVASRKVRGGIGIHLAFGISIGALYMVLSKFSSTFAQSNLIPTLFGVWIPNLIFIAVSTHLYFNAQK